MKRIPKASRIPAAEKLSETLHHVVADPTNIDKWMDLLLFAFVCFGVPGQRGGKRHLPSLTSKVNQAIARFPIEKSSECTVRETDRKHRKQPSDNLAARVSSKLEDSDIRGAIRLAASEDSLAPFSDVTAEALRSKHPSRANTNSPPPPPSS